MEQICASAAVSLARFTQVTAFRGTEPASDQGSSQMFLVNQILRIHFHLLDLTFTLLSTETFVGDATTSKGGGGGLSAAVGGAGEE